ncbi:MAG: hypothetical protein PWQ18_279, partial [Clostridia bacterium]|nr:hypothetical protein [Clostridia bacterium]
MSGREPEGPGRPAGTVDQAFTSPQPPGVPAWAPARLQPQPIAGGPARSRRRNVLPVWQKITLQLARLKPPARAGWPEGGLRQILAPFTRRVERRYALETLRLALTWGLAVAATLLVFLHWTPLPAVKIAAIAGSLAAGALSAW